MALRAHHDRAAARLVGEADAGTAHDRGAGREIGAGHDLHQPFDRDRRVVDIGDTGVDHLAEIVGRDVRRHADGDAAGAVDEEIGEARRQDGRLMLLAVVVRLEVDRVEVEILEQRQGRLVEPGFRVAIGRRRIAVHRAEIALAVDQRKTKREVLRHAHQRVIDRKVAVRMVLTHRIADDAGAFGVGPVRQVLVLVHREQDAPVHGLQAVADIGQSAAHDHAHGVIEVALLHLVGDRDRLDVAAQIRAVVALVVVLIAHVERFRYRLNFKLLATRFRPLAPAWRRAFPGR